MTVADNIRALASEARPVIKEWLDVGVVLASFRDAAKEKGINWSQLKALLVAEAKDNEDGGTRLYDLAQKFDLALSYADMLASPNVASNNNSPTQSVAAVPSRSSSGGEGAVICPPAPSSNSQSEIVGTPLPGNCRHATGTGPDETEPFPRTNPKPAALITSQDGTKAREANSQSVAVTIPGDSDGESASPINPSTPDTPDRAALSTIPTDDPYNSLPAFLERARQVLS